MSDRESFSLLLGGVPSRTIPINLHLATAFKDGSKTMIVLGRDPLASDDSGNEQKWKEWDPRCQPSPFPFDSLTLTSECRCRTPKSKLKLHDSDSDTFFAYIAELIEVGGGVARFVVQLEEFENVGDGDIVATMFTIDLVQS